MQLLQLEEDGIGREVLPKKSRSNDKEERPKSNYTRYRPETHSNLQTNRDDIKRSIASDVTKSSYQPYVVNEWFRQSAPNQTSADNTNGLRQRGISKGEADPTDHGVRRRRASTHSQRVDMDRIPSEVTEGQRPDTQASFLFSGECNLQ